MADRATGRLELELAGCRPEPLASYLKALGVLRLVAEQCDSDARAFWRGDTLVLVSLLDRERLVQFFLGQWRPTPVVAPWNGGSGFYPKDNKVASEAILASPDPRLAAFVDAIKIGRAFIQTKGWEERPTEDDKALLLTAMRATLPEEALAWMDAVVVLGDDRPLFPPLLGTGGNDGRLDFSNNYQQRVVEVLDADSAESAAAPWLNSALFGTVSTTNFKGTMGQYHPAAGGRTNPWDFVLLMEGALVFAGAATRRYETASRGVLAFPFHARAAGGVSTFADGDEGESRDELWLPLWTRPATFREIRRLFAEGRATVGNGVHARTASSALDFARAVASLGLDRGIGSFVRIGFHVRNGLAYYATPLGRYVTRQIPSARLLDDIDEWFSRFREKAKSDTAPARVASARRRLELALFEAATTGALSGALVMLGESERALSRSPGWARENSVRPVPMLSRAWGEVVSNGSAEQRLAAALAARPGMRRRLVPLDRGDFADQEESSVVFTERPLVENLHALLLREDVEQQETSPEFTGAEPFCSLTDIARFIEGGVDDVLIEQWLRALVLVDGGLARTTVQETVQPAAAYAVLALVHQRRLGRKPERLPRTAGYLARACAGDSEAATAAAIRRLNASGRPLPVTSVVEPSRTMRRIAAALAFPLSEFQRRTLERMVLPAPDEVEVHPPSQEPA